MNDVTEHKSEFLVLLERKIDNFKNVGNQDYNKTINIDTLLNIGQFIDSLNSKSKYMQYKPNILHTINYLSEESEMSNKEIVNLVESELSGLIVYLRSEYGFVSRYDWIWSSVFSLVFDLIFYVIGAGQYYYYVPIFTIISLTRNLLKRKKAKANGRFIDF